MKISEKKTIIIWGLIILIIILATALGAIVFGKNANESPVNNMSEQQTQSVVSQEGQSAESGQSEETQVTQKPQESEEAQVTQEPQESEEAQVTQKPQESEEAQVTQKPQESEEAQVTQKPQESEEAQVIQKPQESEEAQMTQKPQESEETQVTQKPQESEEVQATKAPETTEAPKPTEAPTQATGTKPTQLQVKGTQLCDASGNPIQLRGISTHGIGWFPQYVNEACFKQLKQEWNVNVVRLAMYTYENNGYCTDGNKDKLKQLVKDGVKYATNQDLYVIIDWHVLNDQNPNTYKAEAKAFFEEMSKEYKDYTNVIYEICNEPCGGTGWSDVKSYAEEVIDVIRKNDDDAVIIVGTPNWSQFVDQAAADPITGSDNIMYALHFYAATHTNNLRTQMKNAVNNGLPIFVSEYGICDASGNGGIDYNQANEWVKTMDDLGISYIAWNLSNKNETSAILKSSCNKTSGFDQNDLSESGKWLYEMLTGRDASDFTPGNMDANITDQQGNGQGNNQSQTTESTQVPTISISNGEGLKVEAQLVDSWENGSGVSSNYNLTIANGNAADVNGWKLELKFSGNIKDVQGWSGNFSVNGNTLVISNVEYNARIAAGESVKDIGFIVTGESEITLVP